MARIRSIHPSQWTDEAFVSVSAFARLLAIGLRNEADDNGVFEWKPLVLKMRLFPADTIDVSELLEELERSNQVRRHIINGREYGAIRNFKMFQSPRSPKAVFPTNAEIEAFVSGEITETRPVGRPSKQQVDEINKPEPDEFPHFAENNSVMERERDTVTNVTDATSAPDHRKILFSEGVEKLRSMSGHTDRAARSFIGRLLKSAKDDARFVMQAIRDCERDDMADPSSWLIKACSKAVSANSPHKRQMDAFTRLARETDGQAETETADGSFHRLSIAGPGGY